MLCPSTFTIVLVEGFNTSTIAANIALVDQLKVYISYSLVVVLVVFDLEQGS